MRLACPAMHPSPKKSPGPSIATTASLPLEFTTESFTPPACIYITPCEGSPCEKTISFLRNCTTFLASPAESKNFCASKAGFFLGFIMIVCVMSHTRTSALSSASG